MKIGINDNILDKQVALQNRAINKISVMIKRDKPFATEKLDADLKIWAVNNIGYWDDLVEEYGADAVNRLIGETKMEEMRRSKNGLK